MASHLPVLSSDCCAECGRSGSNGAPDSTPQDRSRSVDSALQGSKVRTRTTHAWREKSQSFCLLDSCQADSITLNCRHHPDLVSDEVLSGAVALNRTRRQSRLALDIEASPAAETRKEKTQRPHPLHGDSSADA